MKAARVSTVKIHKAIFGRLQRCVAHLNIWAAFSIRDRRPQHFHLAERYSDFFDWVPDATICSFVVRICSLYDTGEDCITLESYARAIGLKTPIPQDVRSKIAEATVVVQPLRKVRTAYYAHRLAKGTVSDLFEENKLTCDRLFSIMNLTREAAEALCNLTSQRLPPMNLSPQNGLSRLLADLQ